MQTRTLQNQKRDLTVSVEACRLQVIIELNVYQMLSMVAQKRLKRMPQFFSCVRRQQHSVQRYNAAQRRVIGYLSFPQVVGDEPHLHRSGADVRRGRGYGHRGSVVGCQREVKGHGGNGERPVHLHRSGSHTGKALRSGGEVERWVGKEESELRSESGQRREEGAG